MHIPKILLARYSFLESSALPKDVFPLNKEENKQKKKIGTQKQKIQPAKGGKGVLMMTEKADP